MHKASAKNKTTLVSKILIEIRENNINNNLVYLQNCYNYNI